MLGYGQQAGGQHPTGMHSCLFSFILAAIGYHLTLIKTDLFNLEKTTQLIQNHENESQILTDAGTEVTFTLRKDRSECFEQILLELEDRKLELGIRSFSLSVKTLDEVFLK